MRVKYELIISIIQYDEFKTDYMVRYVQGRGKSLPGQGQENSWL